ncbi:hypothetical protein MA16_Dca017480 [Dendrobium catenatum]|uniref:Uncharacterized protein n=1 Tax=Dendrobium catenatum TaxID=906689 RepID=A0A2I0WAT7_9ASPA|nr:hypothetical protein MA16_Dca017480 [Dendrobium catenatum]
MRIRDSVHKHGYHIFAGDGLSIEVFIHGKKAIKGAFRQRLRWGLESETIKLMQETKICVVTDQKFQTIEKVGLMINRFYPKLTSILEDDEENDDDDEEDVKQVMKESNDSDCAKNIGKYDLDLEVI